MNAALRRLTIALLALFGLLFINLNYIHVVAADRLRTDPRNGRLLLESYSHARGEIVTADNTVLAKSVETKDRLKYQRVYSDGNASLAALFAPITGYYSFVVGATGIEAAAEEVLSGTDKRLFTRRLSDIVTGRTVRGGTVRLTLNGRVQQAAAQGLAGRRGAVVALDPRTGGILALVSVPSYDPNPLASHNSTVINRTFTALTKDARLPLLDRAVSGIYPPGSVFKLVTAAAALESGRYTPDAPLLPCPNAFALKNSNRTIKNFGGGSCSAASVPLITALQRSYNTAFAALGVELGADALATQAEKFGFGKRPDLGIPTVAARFPANIDVAQTALSAIGQYDVRVTPLQMALIAAAIANRGVVMAPYLISELQAPDLRTLDKSTPRPLGQAISEQSAAQLTAMMEAVVNGGTGRRAAVPGVRVAGKTGTAQQGGEKAPHAWFVGFAPADAPRVAFAIVIEDGGNLGSEATGGQLAAPIGAQIIRATLGMPQ